MADSINLIFDEDGTARIYDDTYDITIHCESQEEQDAVLAKLNRRWIPCSERPPEVGTTVFITKKPFKINGYEEEVVKAKRSVDPRSGEIKWWSQEFGTLADEVVLAWMPMPEPYGGESE